jgi:hypothetical protein
MLAHKLQNRLGEHVRTEAGNRISEHIVAVRPERSNGREIAAFVCQETHCQDLWRTERDYSFVRDGVGRIGQRCTDVLASQSGICVQEILDRRALRELAQEKFHGYPCSANHGLALHDACVIDRRRARWIAI